MGESIPAGSLAGVDLDKIRSFDSRSANEIARLGSLLEAGSESEAEFLKLCELLCHVGERRQARELLLANSDEGDPAQSLLDREFPDCRRRLSEGCRGFLESVQLYSEGRAKSSVSVDRLFLHSSSE